MVIDKWKCFKTFCSKIKNNDNKFCYQGNKLAKYELTIKRAKAVYTNAISMVVHLWEERLHVWNYTAPHSIFCLNIPHNCLNYHEAIAAVACIILFLNFIVLKRFFHCKCMQKIVKFEFFFFFEQMIEFKNSNQDLVSSTRYW